MPLRQTLYGKICPIGRFEIDISKGGGSYTADPVVECLNCNFLNPVHPYFDLEKICLCPADMTPEFYYTLKKEYLSSVKRTNVSRAGFQEFVKNNYGKVRELKQSKPSG
jgi:hypothetical protein